MRRRTLGICCFILSAASIAVACYFSYRSGCLFDGKTGVGDMAAARQFDLPWFTSLCAAATFFATGVSLVPSRFSWHTLLAGLLAFTVLVLPIAAFLMFGSANSGVSDCNPAASEP
ncbi:hypothetical protein GCM10027430_26910 [Lysobacter tyrosinilyticus]